MEFGNLKIDIGLAKLNDYLFDKSYINGYTPSSADVEVFNSCGTIKEAYFHALRWYNHIKSFSDVEKKAFREAAKASPKQEEEEEVDLFGSDDEEDDEEAARIKQERVDAYAAKKSTKPTLIAKSSITLDVKPWDDETDMNELEKCVRTVQCDGLLWGASKFVPVGYGIRKLQIICIVEDDKVGTDYLEEEITKFEDLIQSVDVAAFNKI